MKNTLVNCTIKSTYKISLVFTNIFKTDHLHTYVHKTMHIKLEKTIKEKNYGFLI